MPEAITRAKAFLTMFGIEGEETAVQAERLDQLRRRRDFVAFLFAIKWPSTIRSSCRNVDNMWAALRSQKASKLPRRVLL